MFWCMYTCSIPDLRSSQIWSRPICFSPCGFWGRETLAILIYYSRRDMGGFCFSAVCWYCCVSPVLPQVLRRTWWLGQKGGTCLPRGTICCVNHLSSSWKNALKRQNYILIDMHTKWILWAHNRHNFQLTQTILPEWPIGPLSGFEGILKAAEFQSFLNWKNMILWITDRWVTNYKYHFGMWWTENH